MTDRIVVESESRMIVLGEQLAGELSLPAVIELVGDVGTGKTTFVKGLAKGLGVAEEISSPTFTVNKKYRAGNVTLSHYDFYRLPEAGLMMDELQESMREIKTVTVIEWGDTVADILPEKRIIIKIWHDRDDPNGRIVWKMRGA
jgi:tRNA threonylcarbamoyladenosine biosynthesis protein TsaE